MLLPLAVSASDRRPCDSVEFKGDAPVRLTEVERKLVCGDPDNEGWGSIPVNQAVYFLRAFLQQRGYQDPSFAVKNGVLEADPGALSFVRSLTVRGLPPAVDPSKLRKLTGVPLTPKALDKVKAALTRALRSRGWACPEIALSADAETGVVAATVDDGGRRRIDEVVPAPLSRVDASVFNRYEAFRRGDSFDARMLDLTAERALADSLFVSAYYDVSCSTSGMRIVQRVVEGKPRLYQLGAGFDTEDLAIAKVQWKNARRDSRGSSLEGTLYMSVRQQKALVEAREYLDSAERLYVKPRGSYERQDRAAYESVNAELAVLPSTSWEGESLRVDISAGPARDFVRTVRGPGPADDAYLSAKTEVTIVDHLFEYYAGEPREGWRTTIQTTSRLAGIDSALTAHRVSAEGEALWNIGGYDPPLLVAGNRWWVGTTYADSRGVALKGLAPEMRFYLGGDGNFRGASYKGLPNDDAGFLTSLYDGVELRLGDVLAHGLQPLAFVDFAAGGRADFELDRDLYWAPGAGLRWALPVGSIRASVARGILVRRDAVQAPRFRSHWEYYFSFGKEF